MKRLFAMFMALALTALVPLSAQASGGHDLNGAELSILWVVPFVCMLLSIAIGPLAVPHFWHHHFGKVALFWGLAFLVPCAMVFGLQLAVYQFVHVLFMEYVPFIILLFALFTIAGGVRLKGQLVGTPVVNAGCSPSGPSSPAGWEPPVRPCCSSGPCSGPMSTASTVCTSSSSSFSLSPTSAAP